jgi:hypothetical protein
MTVLDPATLRHVAAELDQRGDEEARCAADQCLAAVPHTVRARLLHELAAELRTWAIRATTKAGEPR